MSSIEPDIPALIDGLFRRESARLVSSLTRLFGTSRIDLAEDVVQETLVRALRAWPHRGVPDNPAAWLQRAARNLAVDRLRTEASQVRRSEGAVALLPAGPEQAGRFEELIRPDHLDDDQLRMMFVCCHPDLSPESQVALTLKLLCGFGVEELARGLREKPATIAQRLVRAKQVIRDRGLPFELPEETDLPGRLASVLHVLYLLFNEGYSASGGPDLVRDHLCHEAIRLAEILAAHPNLDRPEVDALLALFTFQAARLLARVDGAGDLLLLADQDRARWDAGLLAAGWEYLRRSKRGDRLSRYHLEAGIASLHAAAVSHEETDWRAMVGLYDALLELTGSPIVALHRAVALGKAEGPDAGLQALEEWRGHPSLVHLHLYYAVTGELHAREGEFSAAVCAYERALTCPCTEPERRFLKAKLQHARAIGDEK